MTQLASISQDPWFSRVRLARRRPTTSRSISIRCPDVPFAQVLDVARWIRDELAALGAVGFPKTSAPTARTSISRCRQGRRTRPACSSARSSRRVVSQKHPKQATVERSVKLRGRRVYVDYLQNIPGKTLATAYSARASEYAGVSAPLTWQEVDEGVDREAFTIMTMPGRFKAAGDLWAAFRSSKGVDLERASAPRERRRR